MPADSSLEGGFPPTRGKPDRRPVNGPAVSVVRRLVRRLRSERGFTLIEMMTTMALLAIAVTALVQLSTSGTKAEHELNLRFQAHEEARLGLDVFRREVHNSCSATVSGGGSQVLLMNNAQVGTYPVQPRRLELVHDRQRHAVCALPAGRGRRLWHGTEARRLPPHRGDLLAPGGGGWTAAEGLDRHDGQP